MKNIRLVCNLGLKSKNLVPILQNNWKNKISEQLKF